MSAYDVLREAIEHVIAAEKLMGELSEQDMRADALARDWAARLHPVYSEMWQVKKSGWIDGTPESEARG